MRFIAELQQGGGCDYTIGCGVKVVSLDATDRAGAIQEIEDLLRGDPDEGRPYANEQRLEGIIIYAVDDTITIHTEAIYAKIEKEDAERREAEGKKKRKKEFERLKKEFGT